MKKTGLNCSSCGKKLKGSDDIFQVGNGFYHEECLNLEPTHFIVRDRKTGKEIAQASSHSWGAIDLLEAFEIANEMEE